MVWLLWRLEARLRVQERQMQQLIDLHARSNQTLTERLPPTPCK